MTTYNEKIAALLEHWISPLNGLREVWADLVIQWGYDPADYPALIDELEMACWEAASETAYEVMREHGLVGPADHEESRA